MQPVSFKRHRFPPDVIGLAVWLYFRFTLSFRDVEEMLAQRGIDASYETVRCWTLKFGRLFAQNLRRSRSKPTGRWHLDEMVVKIGGKRMWLWRAVDDEGEVLDMLVQKRRNTEAALRLLRKLLKHQGSHPEMIVTDGLASYRAATRELCCFDRHRRGRMCENNRPRIHTWSFDEGNASSRNSNHKVQPKGSSPPTPLSTTPSTRNVTLSAELRFAFSEPKQITRGRLQLRRHERSCRCCLLASFES
jgi:transposase-like protein